MASYMGHEYTPAPTQVVQGRYRVGDRVRVVKDGYGKGGSRHNASIGDKFTLREWEPVGEFWRTSWPEFYAHEITHAFRPGDRVKLNKHSGFRACGERGTVSAVIGDNVSVRMDDASAYGTVVAFFHADNLDWERAEDCPVKPAHDCAERKDEQYVDNGPTLGDILAAALAHKPEPEPKFKAGDVVRARVSDSAYDVGFLTGNIFVLTGGDDKSVYFLDNDGDARVRPVDEFELVTAAPCPQDNEQPPFRFNASLPAYQPCIVALVKNGKPRPSQWPHVHASVASATTEAERLAHNNPGQEFAVYQRVTARVGEVQMKEVA